MTMRARSPVFLFLLSVFLAGATAPATAETQPMTTGQAAGIVFSEIEKRLIRDYFVQHIDVAGVEDDEDASEAGKGKGKSGQLPPGLAKRDHLPPGLEKHIEKNGVLPPGLAKRSLPSDLVAKLPAAHPGTERKIVGNDVVLLEQGTGIVLDILEGVLQRKH